MYFYFSSQQHSSLGARAPSQLQFGEVNSKFQVQFQPQLWMSDAHLQYAFSFGLIPCWCYTNPSHNHSLPLCRKHLHLVPPASHTTPNHSKLQKLHLHIDNQDVSVPAQLIIGFIKQFLKHNCITIHCQEKSGVCSLS